MRIVHVSDCFPPRTGGIESQVSDLAAHQVREGHEVHVLTATLGPEGERGGALTVEHGVQVHRLGARIPGGWPVNPLRGRGLLRSRFADLRPDVVHVHTGVLSPFAYDGALLAASQGLATAVTWHCMLDGTVSGLRQLARLARFHPAQVALSAVSGAAAERVERAFGQRVQVVPNGVDVDAWAPSGGAHPPRPDRPLEMVATMRLAPRKRPAPLVELVAAAVPRLAPGSVRLTIIGEGPARPAVEAAIADRGMEEVVRLTGRLPREELQAVYRDADVFLAPAELEAFGIAALEARTAGLAVVARQGTGIGEFVRDGVDGFLVADDREMSEAVVLLARDGDVLADMRRHNALVRPSFDWSDVLAAVEREYDRATGLADGSTTTVGLD